MVEEVSNDSGAAGNEAAQIRELVKQAAEPEGFRLFELNFGEGSSGSGHWISFILDPAYPTTGPSIEALMHLGRKVKSTLFEHHIRRVP